MGLLARLDDKVIGPKGKPPTVKQRRQGAAALAALVAVVLIATIVAPGRRADRLWHLLALLGALVVFGGGSRYFRRARYRETPTLPRPANSGTPSVEEPDVTGFAAAILDPESSAERDTESRRRRG